MSHIIFCFITNFDQAFFVGLGIEFNTFKVLSVPQ